MTDVDVMIRRWWSFNFGISKRAKSRWFVKIHDFSTIFFFYHFPYDVRHSTSGVTFFAMQMISRNSNNCFLMFLLENWWSSSEWFPCNIFFNWAVLTFAGTNVSMVSNFFAESPWQTMRTWWTICTRNQQSNKNNDNAVVLCLRCEKGNYNQSSRVSLAKYVPFNYLRRAKQTE